MNRRAREKLVSIVMMLIFASSSGPFPKVSSGSKTRLVCSRQSHILPRYIPRSALKVLRREEGCEQVCPGILENSPDLKNLQDEVAKLVSHQ